jgi:hypothetical protein
MPDSVGFAATRRSLQVVVTHVLARGRAVHGGRFGLRATASGIGTPLFGPDETVLRLVGTMLVREYQTADGARLDVLDLAGRSLAEAARFAGVDLSEPFEPGADAPRLGDPTVVLELDPVAVGEILAWFGTGARVLDEVLPGLTGPTVAQLWPEHFDLGLAAVTRSGRVNLGVSPGDETVPEPYLYVAPWETGRPGDRSFWNAPFGAVLTRSELAGSSDPVAACMAFLRRGSDLLGPA